MQQVLLRKIMTHKRKVVVVMWLTIVAITINTRSKDVQNSKEDLLVESVEELQLRLQKREAMIKDIIRYRQQTMEERSIHMPDVIGIGVKKCGTGALLDFLRYHPLMRTTDKKDGTTFFFNRHYEKGLEFYKDLLPLVNDQEKVMEKTPSYFNSPPRNIPQRIISTLPDVKLLLLVCNPTRRVYSDYVHQRIRYQDHDDDAVASYETFEEYVEKYLPKFKALTKNWLRTARIESDEHLEEKLEQLFDVDTGGLLISTGLYFFHIQRWLRYFNESNLMVINGEKFLTDPGHVLERVQDFIGIPKLLWKEDFVQNPFTHFYCYRKFSEMYLNVTNQQSEIQLTESLECLSENKGRTRNGAKSVAEAPLRQLQNFYEPFNKAFYRKIKQDFNWD